MSDAAIADLRFQLSEAALRRSWQAVNQVIADLEERGPLWQRLNDSWGQPRVGSLGEWLKGCSDWERSAPIGAST